MKDDWHLPRHPPASRHCTSASGSAGFLAHMLQDKNVQSAWQRVQANDGAPGLDGLCIRDLAPCFATEWPVVAARLQSGTWQPLPVRRVSVPKKGGGGRTLGIPAVLDRVVHQAILQTLTPLWEPLFSPCSFAYRRGRGVRDALQSLAAEAERMPSPTALHLDIRQFFDRVPRAQALQAVRCVADEDAFVSLVESILSAGAFERGQVVPTPHGLPQGSPLSPLLANAVLHPFDLWLTQIVPGFARYADDIVILLPSKEKTTARLEQIQQRLSRLGLELNTAKTQQSSLADMSFLGFCLWRDSAGRWRRRITPAAWAALEAELAKHGSLPWNTFGMDECTSQDYLTGWLSHFGTTECPQDHARLTELRQRHPAGGMPEAKGVRLPYDGGVQTTPSPSHQPEPSRYGERAHESWWQTVAVWWARLRVGRLVRVGVDMDRRKNGFLPRLNALRLTIFGFTIRLRL